MSEILNRGIECSITYQVGEERPLKWWKDIIDRLVSVGANTLVVCPSGDGFWYPEAYGYDYPSKKLKQFRNPNCLNADPKTEYLSKVIDYANKRGVNFWFQLIVFKQKWLTDAFPEMKETEVGAGPRLCRDHPETMGLIKDMIEDLKGLYPDVYGYSLVQIRWQDCHCPYTISQFQNYFKKSYKDATKEEWDCFRSMRTRDVLGNVLKYLKKRYKVYAHIEGVWDVNTGGLMGKYLKECGFNGVVSLRAERDNELTHKFIESYGKYFDKLGILHDCRDKGSSKNWTWLQDQTPESIINTTVDLREYLRDNNLKVDSLTFWNFSALKEDHPNIDAIFKALGLLI